MTYIFSPIQNLSSDVSNILISGVDWEFIYAYKKPNHQGGKQFEIIHKFNKTFISISLTRCPLSNARKILSWKLQKTGERLISEIKDDSKYILTSFCHRFLLNELKNERNFPFDEPIADFHPKILNLTDLRNNEDSNLLIIAVIECNEVIVNMLLKSNFDTAYENNTGLVAIEYAWKILIHTTDSKIQTTISNIILNLLKNNSLFPRFEVSFDNATDELKGFIKACENLRKHAKTKRLHLLKIALDDNPSMRYFYDLDNESLLQYTMKCRCDEAYHFLTSHNITTGLHEDPVITVNYLTKIYKILSCINVPSSLLRIIKCSINSNNDSKIVLSALLRRLTSLCSSQIPLKILEIVSVNKNIRFFINHSQDQNQFKEDQICFRCKFTNNKELDCEVRNIISRLCDFVADISCLDHYGIILEFCSIRKILKYYCGAANLTEDAINLLSNESTVSYIKGILCESLEIIEKLQDVTSTFNINILTEGMQDHIIKISGNDAQISNLQGNKVYQILLNHSLKMLKAEKLSDEKSSTKSSCFQKVQAVDEILEVAESFKGFLLIEKPSSEKSIELSNLAKKLQYRYKEFYLLILPFSEYRSKFEQNRSLDDICSLLLSLVSPENRKDFVRELKSSFKDDKIVLIFDEEYKLD